MRNASLRVEVVTGPPGSGKTTRLAAAAVRYACSGEVAVICSHPSSCRAFQHSLAALGVQAAGMHTIAVDTLAGHLAAWMRAQYAACGVSPELRVGGSSACARLVKVAAAGLLDLSWTFLRAGEIDLDLPFLGRPARFLEEAGSLFRQLRRLRVSPADFEEGCAAGLIAFYGDDGHQARVRLRDPGMRARLSRRGRDAVKVSDATLAAQRRAERELIRVLARLYREYILAGQLAAELCEEDAIARGVDWLATDSGAARSIATALSAVIIDDAEDAEPALVALLDALRGARPVALVIAGWDDAQTDGLRGRRSALNTYAAAGMYSGAAITQLPVRRVPANVVEPHRFSDEAEEADWIAAAISGLLCEGTLPRDIAVLARSIDAAAVYGRHLEQRGLPILAPPGLFESFEDIFDLLALAAVVDDPHDQEHLLRVLASPLVGCSDASLWALCKESLPRSQLEFDIATRDLRHVKPAELGARVTLAENMLEAKIDELLPAGIRQTLAAFRERLKHWREELTRAAPAAVLARLLKEAGFCAHWASAATHRRARLFDDGARIIEAVAALHATEAALPLRDLVRAVEDGAAPLREAKRSPDAIACDAIVDVKGERWPHVFVAGIAHERFPRVYVSRGMAFTRAYGLIVRENVAGGPAQTAKFAWYYAKFDAKSLYIKEERRVLRYALARADVGAAATGYGRPPSWAADHDLLADFEMAQTAAARQP